MARPRIQVLIDWNGDGAFTGANADITSDVRSLAVEQFRDLRTEYVHGRVLDVDINNGAGKYNPSLGGLAPGRKLWVRCWYPYDGFAGPANTALADHTPDEDGDWPWSGHGPAIELDGLGSARTRSGGAVGRRIAAMPFADPDVTIASHVTRGASVNRIGLCVRFKDTHNYAYVVVNGANVEVRKTVAQVDSGVIGPTAHGLPWGANVRRLLRVELHGTAIRVTIDRKAVLEGVLDDPAINDATSHGLFAEGAHDHTWQDFGGYRGLFYGVVGKVRPRPGLGRQYCYVQAYDDFERAKRVELRSYNIAVLSTTNYHHRILDYGAAGPDRRLGTLRRMNDGLIQDYQPVTDSLLTAIYRLQDEEDGLFYVDSDGFYRFEERGHRATAHHKRSTATYRDAYDGSDPGFTDEEWEAGTDHVENRHVIQYRRATGSGRIVEVWRSHQAEDGRKAIRFEAGETLTVVASIAQGYYDAASYVIPSAAGQDYAAHANADGSGASLTDGLTVTIVDTGRFWASAVKLKVEAAGTLPSGTGGYLTRLRLRGYAVRLDDPAEAEASDDASIETYGERRKFVRCNFITNHEEAALLAASRLKRRKAPKPVLTLTLTAGDKPTLHNMVQRGISDRVTISESALGIDEDFFIEGESWKVSHGGARVVQRLQLRGV